MAEIVFVGLGLHDETGMTLRGLEEVKTAESVFLELYTNIMRAFSTANLKKISGRMIHIVSREQLEDENGDVVLRAAEAGKTVLLVPGDPLIATTHVALRVRAERLGIKTRVVHGASILSAAIGLSGLHNYKFGKSVTIPFPSQYMSETPYEVIAQNKRLGLHTLCFLDIDVEKGRYLKIQEGLEHVVEVEKRRREEIFSMDTLVVGLARVGSPDFSVKADFLRTLLHYDFGDPPHSIIFPGELHFMEAESLIVLADAPEELRKMVR